MSTSEVLPLTPSTRTSSRVWCPFHAALVALIATLAFFFCGQSVADPDIWWHMENARILLTEHHWIRFDSYSYTVKGTPWVNSEWLSEIAYYAAWKAGGLKGLFTLYSFMAEYVTLGVLFLAYKVSGSIKAATLASILAVVLAVVNFGPRTILFGWACMVAVMLILWKEVDRGDAPLWLLPFIFCLWANLHGSWLIGLVVFAMVVASRAFNFELGNIEARRWTPTQFRRLVLSWLISVCAVFVNPYGYKLVFYPFDLAFRQKLNVEHVEEWASINFHEPRGKIVFVLILLILALAFTAKEKWSLTEVFLIGFSLYASLTYIRFLFLAAILLTPIIARRLTFVPPYKREIDRSWLNALFVVVLCGIIVHRFPKTKTLSDDLEKKYPMGAIRYLQQHPNERVLNHYMWGGYMIWAKPPIPTFIDSRTDIFEYKGVLADYLDILSLKNSLELIDKYHPDLILFPSKDPVTYLLRHSQGWHIAYEDGASCIFARDRHEKKMQ